MGRLLTLLFCGYFFASLIFLLFGMEIGSFSYWIKHLFILFAAAIVVAGMRVPKSLLIAIGPMVLGYAVCGFPLQGAVMFITLLATHGFARHFDKHLASIRWSVVLLLLMIAFTVLFTIVQDGSLYSTTYGRQRLNTGLGHPKEVGSLVAALVLVLAATLYGKHTVFSAGVMPVLLLIGSRNAFLLILLNSLARFFQPMILGLGGASVLVATYLYLGYDGFDYLTSFRLSRWLEYLQGKEIVAYGMFSQRFGVDNFYLEVLLAQGYVLGAITLFWFLAIAYWYARDIKQRALLIALLTYGFFDTGLMTSGNPLHLGAWTLIQYFRPGHRHETK